MSGGPNLTPEELQQLRDLFDVFKDSEEVRVTADAEDYDYLDGTSTLINMVRFSRPEGDTQ